MQPPAPRNRQTGCACPAEKRVVLVGASVRAAAQSASRAGFCVTGIDLFGDSDTREACHCYYQGSLAEEAGPGKTTVSGQSPLAQQIKSCRGAPAVVVGGLRPTDRILQSVGGICRLIGPSSDCVRRLKDPAFLSALAASAGLRFPETITAASLAQKISAGDGWLIKQRLSCGGLGVRRSGSGPNVAEDEYIQRSIAGRSFGATLLASDGGTFLLGVCRSLFTRRGRLPFVYAGSLGPIEMSDCVNAKLLAMGERVVELTKLRGLFNIDFLIDRSGQLWLIEINPRWSASSELVQQRLLDRRLLRPDHSLFAVAMQSCGLPIPSRVPIDLGELQVDSAVGLPIYLKRIVYTRGPVQFDPSSFGHLGLLSDGAMISKRTAEMHAATVHGIHDIPTAGTDIGRSEPMFTLISRIDANEKNPMQKHRVLLRKIHAASLEGYKPRSSA